MYQSCLIKIISQLLKSNLKNSSQNGNLFLFCYLKPYKQTKFTVMSNLNKENILSKTDSFQILNFYLKPYHNEYNLKAGQNISNPFLADKQKTPSFNIFQARGTAEWRFKDFATGDEGSCFDLVMKLFNITFPETLKKINDDFVLNLSQNDSLVSQGLHQDPNYFKISKKNYSNVLIQ